MSDSPHEHVDAAEEDPTSTDVPVSALVIEEDDLPDRDQDDEVQVGLGPVG